MAEFGTHITISLTLAEKSADRVAIAVGWRQGETIYGLRGRDDHRRGMVSNRPMSPRCRDGW
jgi:hypothetical protein